MVAGTFDGDGLSSVAFQMKKAFLNLEVREGRSAAE